MSLTTERKFDTQYTGEIYDDWCMCQDPPFPLPYNFCPMCGRQLRDVYRVVDGVTMPVKRLAAQPAPALDAPEAQSQLDNSGAARQ